MGLRGRMNLVEEQFYFVTTTVVEHAHVFTENTYCDLLINNIKHYQEIYHFLILGYVIMPSHFHWILKTEPRFGTLSDIMRDIKKYSAWDIMDELEKRNETKLLSLFFSLAEGCKNQKRKFWESRFDDEVLRNQKMFYVKLNYVHNNPVKAGLVRKPEDYKYSSARNYIMDDHSVIFVDTSYLN
jgi:putative transposase